MDVCIGASHDSLVPILSINLENTLSLFGLNSKISLYGVNYNYKVFAHKSLPKYLQKIITFVLQFL